jgi:hypothetical protein
MMNFPAMSRTLLMLACLLVPWMATAEQTGECGLCGGPITESNNPFVIVGADGTEQKYGCPGCGLEVLGKMDMDARDRAKVQDFLRRTMIDANQAWYLRGTEIGFCCEPYWLAFANKEEAEKFAKGFGGEVLDFEAALKAVQTDHLHMLHEVQ